jgi:hypothetical protein
MRMRLIAVLFLSGLASPAFVPITLAQTGDVAIVVSQKNPVTDLSTRELRQIFTGEKRSWSSGLPIKLFVRAPGTHESIVLLKLLDMTESEYKRHWISQVFRGEVQAEPITLFSNDVQRQAVLVYPGAVTLIEARDLKPGMKVIRVDGRTPGQEGYALH